MPAPAFRPHESGDLSLGADEDEPVGLPQPLQHRRVEWVLHEEDYHQ